MTADLGAGQSEEPFASTGARFKCTSDQTPSSSAAAASYKVKTSYVSDYDLNSDGVNDSIPTNVYVLENEKLRGSLSVCPSRSTFRDEQQAGVKFTPEDPKSTPKTAAWEDHPYPPENLTGLKFANSTMHWYQEGPEEPGVYLVIPRVYKGDCAPTVNDHNRCVLAQGRAIRFCVTTNRDEAWPYAKTPKPCPPAASADPPQPTAAGTFGGSDDMGADVPPLLCTAVTHHWHGTMQGVVAPDTESSPTQSFDGQFQLDAAVECENVRNAIGNVGSFTLTSGALQFQFLSSLKFVRVGYAVTAQMFGICSSPTSDSYVCVLTMSGVWTPRYSPGPDDRPGADLTSGTVAINYDSNVDTWEEP